MVALQAMSGGGVPGGYDGVGIENYQESDGAIQHVQSPEIYQNYQCHDGDNDH